MGYALLWLEVLAGELLLLATLVACIARIRWQWLRRPLLVFLVVVSLMVYAVLVVLVRALEAKRLASDGWATEPATTTPGRR